MQNIINCTNYTYALILIQSEGTILKFAFLTSIKNW